MKIKTSHDIPPIATRKLDWSAIDSDTYDCDWQGEETGYVSNSPIGHGESEAEAIRDLLDQIEERA